MSLILFGSLLVAPALAQFVFESVLWQQTRDSFHKTQIDGFI